MGVISHCLIWYYLLEMCCEFICERQYNNVYKQVVRGYISFRQKTTISTGAGHCLQLCSFELASLFQAAKCKWRALLHTCLLLLSILGGMPASHQGMQAKCTICGRYLYKITLKSRNDKTWLNCKDRVYLISGLPGNAIKIHIAISTVIVTTKPGM